MKTLAAAVSFVSVAAIASAEEAASGTPAAPPPPSNLGWVMAANLVIWGGIALYIFWLHRRAASLEKGE